MCFKTFDGFVLYKARLDQTSVIYLDSNLDDNIKGEKRAKTIFENGFTNIFLATGYPDETFAPNSFIKAIIGKEPPLA